jgi:hypothetical protein
VARALRITFVDPKSWIDDEDFARGGLNLNGRRKRRLGQLYARVSELDVEASPSTRQKKLPKTRKEDFLG